MGWVSFVFKHAAGRQKAAISLVVVEKNVISNLNRPSSTADNYSEMHSTADSTGPVIVIKAIL